MFWSHQQLSQTESLSTPREDESMASEDDCEDISNSLYMEDDSLLDEFLFNDASSVSTDSARFNRIDLEEIAPNSLEKTASNSEKQLKISLESPIKTFSQDRLDSAFEGSASTNENASGTDTDNVVIKQVSKSMMGMTTMLFFKLDSSWWKKWNFREIGRPKLRSLDSRRQIEHRKFRHEVHRKLSRIELKSLKLNTHSHYDLIRGNDVSVKAQARELQKSASVTGCCPGLATMNCAQGLINRLHTKFTIIRKSSEKVMRYILKKNVPENNFLLRWIQYMKVPRVQRRGLKRRKHLERWDCESSLFEGTPGFLQGKLWYVINAKNIDCSHAARVQNPNLNETKYDIRVRQSLMRHVIRYMDVLKNYPELSLLSPGRNRDFLRFSTHKTAARYFPKPIWPCAKVMRGHLNCSDRYFLKRRLYTLQQCLESPEWFRRVDDTVHEHDNKMDNYMAKNNNKFSKSVREGFIFGGRSNRRCDSTMMYRKPKVLEIPTKCSSLYESIYHEISQVCCKHDPRIIASRPDIGQELEAWAPITFDLRKDQKSNIHVVDLDPHSAHNRTDIFLAPCVSKPESKIIAMQKGSADFSEKKELLTLSNCNIRSSENYALSEKRTRHRENFPLKLCPNESSNPPCISNFTPELRRFDISCTQRSSYCSNCLRSEVSEQEQNKRVARSNGASSLSHPSIRARLTKQDTLDLLRELCCVQSPLSPLPEDNDWPHDVDATFPANGLSVESRRVPIAAITSSQPSSSDSINSKESHHRYKLIDKVATCEAVQDMQHVTFCAVPMQCHQAVRCSVCGVTLIQFCGPAQTTEMRAEAKIIQNRHTSVQNCCSYKEPNDHVCDEVYLANMVDGWSPSSCTCHILPTNLASHTCQTGFQYKIKSIENQNHEPSIKEEIPREDNKKHNSFSSTDLGEKYVQELLINEGNLNVEEETINGFQISETYPPSNICKPHRPNDVLHKKSQWINSDATKGLHETTFRKINKPNTNVDVYTFNEHDYTKKLTGSANSPAYKTYDRVHAPDFLCINTTDGEQRIEICGATLDFSNNHGSDSGEETQKVKTPVSTYVNDASDYFSEDALAAGFLERDYICDDMSTPIVLSAADRVYHVSSTLNTQVLGLSSSELTPIGNISQRDANFDVINTAVVDTACDSFLSHMCYKRPLDETEEPFLTNADQEEESCQGQDILSKAMQTAGLTDEELETFLISDSTIEAFLADNGELNLDDFIPSKQHVFSGSIMEQQTEMDHFFGPNFESILSSNGCVSETSRIDRGDKMLTSNIRLETFPATQSHTVAHSFQLLSDDDEVGFGEISLNDTFPVSGNWGLDSKTEIHACPDVHKTTGDCANLRYQFIDETGLNQGAYSTNIIAGKEQDTDTYPNYLKQIGSPQAQGLFSNTSRGKDLPITSEQSMDNSSDQSKHYFDNFVSPIFTEALNQSASVTGTSVVCNEYIPWKNRISSPKNASFEAKSFHCIYNSFQNEPEALDLQPLANNFLEIKEDEEEEEGNEKDSENIRIKATATVGRIKDNSQRQHFTVLDSKPPTSPPTNDQTSSWCLRHRESIRTCMEQKALRFVRQRPRLCCPPSESPTLDTNDKTDTLNTEDGFGARNIIRINKSVPVCEVKLQRIRTNQTQNKRRRKGKVRKTAVQRKRKDEKIIKLPIRKPRKYKPRSKSTMAPARKKKFKKYVSEMDKPYQSVTSTSGPCREMRKRDGHQKKSREISELSVTKDHFNNEILKAETFSKHLRSFSPGFLKKKVPTPGDILTPPDHANKISMRFPRPLVASKTRPSKSVAMQKKRLVRPSCTDQSLNKNNNSLDEIDLEAYMFQVMLRKCTIKTNFHIQIHKGSEIFKNSSAWPKCREVADYKKYCENGGDYTDFVDRKSWRISKSKLGTDNHSYAEQPYTHTKCVNYYVPKCSSFKPFLRKMESVDIDSIDKNKETEFDINCCGRDKTSVIISNGAFTTTNDGINRSANANELNDSNGTNYFRIACNTNNNSNSQQDIGVHHSNSNNQEAEEKQESWEKTLNHSNPNRLEKLQETRLSSHTMQGRDDLWSQKGEIIHELPRIGKNMENFHAARRRLKEVNARLTRIHGKQKLSTMSKAAPAFAKILGSSNDVSRRRGEIFAETLGPTQRRERIGSEQAKERLLAKLPSKNSTGLRDLDGFKHSAKDPAVSTKVRGTASWSRKQNWEHKEAKVVSFKPRLQSSFKILDNGVKESSTLPKKFRVDEKDISQNSKETKDAKSQDKPHFEESVSSAVEPRVSSNSRRDMNVGLARFVERLNSDYGQQLTRGDPHNQSRLEQLCSRYIETLKVRKRLEEKLTGSARSTFNRSDVRAALAMDNISNPQSDLQKRKRKGSSLGEIQGNVDLCTSPEDEDSIKVKVNPWETDTNENMKKSEDSEKDIKKTGHKTGSQSSVVGTKIRSLSVPSTSGMSSLSRLSQTSQSRIGITPLKSSINSKRIPRVKSNVQLRPDLKESVERLSSQPQPSVARLQHDISTWETNFGKHFSVGVFDKSNPSHGRFVNKSPSSPGGVPHTSRSAKTDSGSKYIPPLLNHQNAALRQCTEKKSMSNSVANSSNHSSAVTRTTLPEPTQSQSSGEDRINTFFGSLLNLIDQKEKQKTNKGESPDSQTKLCSSATTTATKQTKECRDDSESKKREEREKERGSLVKKDVKEGTVGRKGSSSIGTMYRNMLEKIKCKRSSFVMDPDDPLAIPPLPSLSDITTSLEPMPNFPQQLLGSKLKDEKSSKCLDASLVKNSNGENALSVSMLASSRDVTKDCLETVPTNFENQPSLASRDEDLSPSYISQSSPHRLHEKGFIDDIHFFPPSKLSLTKKENIMYSETPPRSVRKEIHDNLERNEQEKSMLLNSEKETTPKSPNFDKSFVFSPKMNVSNLVKAKSPEASVSKISVVCDSIKCPLGGGDNEDEKEGHIQPPFASGASDILSFTVGFTASSEMLSSAETPKRKTSNQDLHLNSQISPRCISPKTLKSNASVSNKSSLTSFSESKNESLAWMELEDLKNYHSEVSEYNLRPRQYREVNADKPLLTGVEPPSDGSSYCVINEERFSKSPVNKSFQGVGSANPGIGDYFREDVRPTTQFQVDHRSGYDESTTSYARLSAHNFETYPTTTDNSGFNSKNVFSRQNRPFNAELTGFNTNTTVFDGSHSQYEIKPLDALELQAERDFGNIYGDKRHKTTERPGWSLWKQDSRDMAAELSSAENVTNTQGQVTSPYHRPMRMATGYNVDHDVRATDTEHTAYESYFANNPISNYSFASERPYAEYALNQGYKLGTDAGARLSAPSWSDYASSSMTRSVRTPAAPYYSRQDHPENCQSANIPWDQLAAPVSTALDPRSLTALESDRRSLGYSYLTPIQEESEEDQRDGGH